MTRKSHGGIPKRRRAAAVLSLSAVTAATLMAVTAVPASAGLFGPTPTTTTTTMPAKFGFLSGSFLSGSFLKLLGANALTAPTTAPTPTTVPAAVNPTVGRVDLRVLVLATKGDPNPNGIDAVPAGSWDYELSTVTDSLNYLGVPYDTYKSTTKQLCVNGSWVIDHKTSTTETTCTSGAATTLAGGLTGDKLFAGDHALYQGVMLTNGTLSYQAPDGTFVSSALSVPEWTALWSFESAFGIRQVSTFTYPTADYGFTGVVSEGGDAITASYTAAGAAAFRHVNAAGTLPIANSWSYRAKTNPADTTTTPLITDTAGNALAVIHSYPNEGNRQALAVTFDSASYLTHGQVLGYGLVSWVTKGLFLGERHALLDAQPDDVYIEDSTWPVGTPCGTNIEDPKLPTYRITGSDLQALSNWQNAKQAQPATKALALELPFNGEGTQSGYTAPAQDTLTPYSWLFQSKFKWVNHTYDHTNLDAVSYATAVSLIDKNNQVAAALGFKNYSKTNLIQPDISGLKNPEFLRAAVDKGVKYLVSDTSRDGNPGANGPNEGHYNPIQPSLLEIARYPVNLYYNVGTPQQWLAEDNCLYPAGAPFGHVDTYAQLLDRESNVLLRYLLLGHNRPLMFHQTNLRAYDGTHSVLGDLIDATMTKYNRLETAPLISPTMNQIGALQADRMKYNDAWKTGGLSASISGTSITLTSQKAVTVPVTGMLSTAYPSETYGGAKITYVTLAAGQTVTLPLQ